MYWFACLLSHYYHQISILSSIMWNRDMFSLYPSHYWLRKWRGRGGGVGAIQERCLFNIVAYGGQLFSFWGSGCWDVTYTNELQIQRMIFFFLILEMVTFATSPPIKCVWNNLWGVNRFMVNFNSIGKTVWMQRFMQRVNKTDWFFLPDL